MTYEQTVLFCLFGGVFAALLWGRYRYDLIAFSALVFALLLGAVPVESAFSGFGHPATVIVALVLIISRGLIVSGAVDQITKLLISKERALYQHIALMGGTGGFLSAFMNNVAALALLMPVELQASEKAGRSPGIGLMPLAFATILGGLVTLIGTPPNIIVASFRAQALGEPFQMFDFAPVGLACAVAGITFVAFIGWRLIPVDKSGKSHGSSIPGLESYIAELVVTENSTLIGGFVESFDADMEEADAAIIGLVKRGRRMPGLGRGLEIREGDIMVIEGSPEAIDRVRASFKLEVVGEEKHKKASGGVQLLEVVIPDGARIVGRSVMSAKLLSRRGVTLLGVSRKGKQFRERVRKLEIEPGDVLLLIGPNDRLTEAASFLGGLPLAERGLDVTQYGKSAFAAGFFAFGIALASFGFLDLSIALALVALLYVASDIVPVRELYDHIEWPVIVLIGSMIPLGAALESSGGTELISSGILWITQGYSAPVVLCVLLVATMTLSDILNNTATTVIAAPIAISLANSLGVNPDAFLMAVAVGASCAFLTPIGHKNNTLIMGPGGYKFGDYWRMGLPLEIVVVVVAVPSILIFWPL